MAQAPDPFELDGVRARAAKPSFPWAAIFFAGIACVLGLLILSPYPEKIRRKLGLSFEPAVRTSPPKVETKIVYEDRVVEKIVIPKGSYYQLKDGTDIARTSSGFDFKSSVDLQKGDLASKERETPGSYAANFTLAIRQPKAALTVAEVRAANPYLSDMLPGLPKLLENAKVSHFYDTLYQNKADRLQSGAHKLDELLSKHNYYDCQTMLQMEHPDTKRKVFLMQADMDVVADGSDGDRLAQMPDEIVNSTHYQPFTSWGWPKTGNVENPMATGWKKRVEKANVELADPATTATRKTWLKDRIKMLKTGIADMEKRSFLIAEHDPFMVIPVNFIRDREDPYGPNVGDYVCVIHGKRILPAIVGDGGPTFKVGEASLRLAKEINSLSTPYHRPVSDVSATYFIFPRSAGDNKAPDYAEWRSECAKLLEEIGGLSPGFELHEWENTLPE
ncbi:glycoside hydrolase family 75 protein [Akkermansiaceae bacterium]|nr:glycoside hydrolase family 75 protein [bacterium]MDB4562181.1 glycoside hydrolase family 75 protein [Akkermansiaceae bacterium]MDB4585192.1 glycoside hydrolase family 75 protein [Akkermansiaceae bacterium]